MVMMTLCVWQKNMYDDDDIVFFAGEHVMMALCVWQENM